MGQSRVSVLLVEDDDVDAEAVMCSIRPAQVPAEVVLNMPRMDGFEFLQALRSDPRLHDLVVFVLSTSAADADRTRAYRQNIAGYLVKSAVGPKCSRLARMLPGDRDAVSVTTPDPGGGV
ncbi:MAG TPA: response regulator [Kineosporiaceae bacterium]|nr:response regulator [Kineosporiaceae bacterium]